MGATRGNGPVPADPSRENAELKTVLEAIGIAVATWGNDGTLRFSNRKLAEIFGLDPESLLPGLAFADFIALALQGPALEGRDAADLLLAMPPRGQETACFIERLSDGRQLSVTSIPLASGGWLTTYKDVTEHERTRATLVFQAQHDELTKLANRSLFHERLADVINRARTVAVLSIDLDQFKVINDIMGHAAGDALLCNVARRLSNGHRQSDIVARLGGDEFAIMLNSATTREAAVNAAQRVIQMLSRPFEVGGQTVRIGASIGIAMCPGDGRNPDTLLRNADMALSAAKADGRGTCRCFEQTMADRVRENAKIESGLRLAIANRELEMFYQPLVCCATRSVSGFEALMRWRHPTRGMIAPGHFIPVAEACDLISALGGVAVEQACADAAAWPPHLKVTVNLSPVQIRLGDVTATIMNALARTGLAPNRLVMEVTESVLINDEQATRQVLKTLRENEIGVALDDFGTGFSSLAYIQKFQFNKIKIDKLFVNNIDTSLCARTIVRSVIDIAASLGAETVAEGVETVSQYDQLAAIGCGHVQGYLFSPPRPASSVARMVWVINNGLSQTRGQTP